MITNCRIARLAAAMTLFALVNGGCASTPTSEMAADLSLYALDCGRTHVGDMRDFSIGGEYAGRRIELANPCFLIRHRNGDLIWETGLSAELLAMPDGFTAGAYRLSLKAGPVEQLARLGLTPADIEYLALSHSHSDHAGNANLFAGSTFIVSQAEHRFMFSAQKRTENQDYAYYALLSSADTITFEREHDVFGDGSVMIRTLPGHTPGNSALLVRLAKSGPLLLTGDLYTHARARARELGTVTVFESDPAALGESRAAFESWAGTENARVIIQHELRDFESLPAFPAFPAFLQ